MMSQLLLKEGYATVELSFSLFPGHGAIQTCSQQRPVVRQRRSSESRVQRFPPHRGSCGCLWRQVWLPRADSSLDQLGSPQQPPLGSQWGSEKILPLPASPCCCPSFLVAFKARPGLPGCWAPLLLKIPAHPGKWFTSPWPSEPQDRSGALLCVIPVSKSLSFEWK